MADQDNDDQPQRLNVKPEAITFDAEGRVVIDDDDFAELTRQALGQVADGTVGTMGISIPIIDVICDNQNRNCRC